MSAIPQGAVAAFEAYWRVKETGGPPAFIDLPVKLQQCWIAAADAVAAAERRRLCQLADEEVIQAVHRGFDGVALSAFRRHLKDAP